MTYLFAMTIFHTALSLLAILAGVPAMIGLFAPGPRPARAFLILVGVTSVTGFLFPFKGVTPAFVTGVIALAVLALLLLARSRFALARAWRAVYAATMVVSLYLLVFVGIVQAFQKLPLLHRLAPTQTEPAFVATQLAALVGFIVLGIAAALRARGAAPSAPIELVGVRAPGS